MRILVYIEHAEGQVAETSLEALAVARDLGGEVEALVCSADTASLASQLGAADRIIAAEGECADIYLPSQQLAALKAAIVDRQPDLTLLSYTTAGLDLAAPAAHASGWPLIGNVVSLKKENELLVAQSQSYGGKLDATTNMPSPGVVVLMPGAARAETAMIEGTPPIEIITLKNDTPRMRILESLPPDRSGVDLSQCERILCVGRAIGGTDKLPMAEELAALLTAEIAGSRPVIDAGWLPKSRQVGKSGTKVKPRLYLAAGVSGAPEHLEGMSEAELIIALNTDEGAPIFAKAHYGAVCDMFDVLPALISRLKNG